MPSARLASTSPKPENLATVRPRLLRRSDAAAYLAISVATLDEYRLQGLIRAVPLPAARNGGQLRTPVFDRHDLDCLIDRLKEGGDR